MMMTNANTSFLRQFRIVFGFIYELRSLSRRRGVHVEEEAAVVAGKEDDLETGPPEEETNVQTNRAVRNSVFEKALSIFPTFPASFLLFTLPGLYALLQIKWQLPLLAFPSPTLHRWYIVCVTSLITEFVASVTQWIISAAAESGPQRVKYFETDTSCSSTTTLCACQISVF